MITAGHYVFREQSEAFNSLLRSFCLRHFVEEERKG